MRELNLSELTTRQKLGMIMVGCVSNKGDNIEPVLELIRNHSLGAVWINPEADDLPGIMAKIKEAADYPIIIMCDAEVGIGDYPVGMHNAIGTTGSEELAYLFGKTVGVTAHAMGYNVVCNPVLDMANGRFTCGGNNRSLGNDKYKVSALAKAEIRGMHDAGLLSVCKHYPGTAEDAKDIDAHMAETKSYVTKEELLDYNLFPYLELMKEGLLDGIMTEHTRFMKIDDEYPASLSKKVTNILREQGFDGFMMTDALMMMGVVARFGWSDPVGLAIAGGNDIALPCISENMQVYEWMCQSYDKGLITDERLDEAARRVLEAQHKTTKTPVHTSLTDEDKANFERLSTDNIFLKTDDGVTPSISKDGKHCFVILTETELDLNAPEKIEVDTFSGEWFKPLKIAEKLRVMFPNSVVRSISEYPTVNNMRHTLEDTIEYEDIVFITFFNSRAYVGIEAFSPRIISVMNAFQATDRISTIVHLGNPYMLEDVPHISRVIIGPVCEKGVYTALDVLAGDYPAKGVLTYDVKFR